jgi:hypothetical protein
MLRWQINTPASTNRRNAKQSESNATESWLSKNTTKNRTKKFQSQPDILLQAKLGSVLAIFIPI